MMFPTEGGGGRSTDWKAFDVPTIWAMLDGFDTDPQWTHVSGWQKTFDLTSRHLARMKSYREQLAAAWPPEKNEASRVYLVELDKLIESVQSTYDAAIANHGAMAAATGAILSAKGRVKPIHERWQAQASTMAAYEAKVAQAKPGVPAPMPGPPPLSPHWRDDLNREARAVMDDASGEVALAAYRMVMPRTYDPPRGPIDPAQNRQAGDGEGSTVPPVIPPVVPRPPSVVPEARVAPGPALAGLPNVDPKPALTPPATDLPTPPTRAAVPAPVTNGPGPGILQPLPAQQFAGRDIGGHSSIGAQRTTSTTPAPVQALRPTTPPSGIIGAMPPANTGQLSPRTGQFNPVGGVIRNTAGSAGAAPSADQTRRTAAGGNSATSYRTPDGHVVRISTSSSASPVAQAFGITASPDPDDPWKTEEGVPAVLAPAPPPRRHDPGPAIGLTD